MCEIRKNSHDEVQYRISNQNVEKRLSCVFLKRKIAVRLYTPVYRKPAQNTFRKQHRNPEMEETQWSIAPGAKWDAEGCMGKR